MTTVRTDPKALLARLELPFLPSRDASPNGRAHWTKRYKAVRKLKEDTFMFAMSQQVPAFRKAKITITLVVTQHRRRDGDNALASCIGIINGLVAAKVLPDDSSEYVSFAPVQFIVDRAKAPMTIVELMERQD